jgi:hypothetical protein
MMHEKKRNGRKRKEKQIPARKPKRNKRINKKSNLT